MGARVEVKLHGKNRQREIIEALDITKNQATAQLDEKAETEAVAVKKKTPARSIRP
ncbi:MAG: hypothetical protein QM680_00965 [Luteolibacter sp.]